MATYTNLASLEGLQVGDVVTYTSTTAFDTKGYKFEVKLYGGRTTYTSFSSYKTVFGGAAIFKIDTSLLPSKILTYSASGGYSLCYGEIYDAYYRIGVAGSAGKAGRAVNASSNAGGTGGGSVGGTGKGGSYTGATGGTQTSGGSGVGSGQKGSFGAGGAGGNECGRGGDGWYGGGGGGYYSSYTGAGGGSGFIIGVSTTTYPSGYLGDDTSLQSTIASAISEGKLTQGGSDGTVSTGMILTILELPPVEGEPQSTLKYFNGTDFIDTNAKYYNGSELVNCDVYYYDGTELKKI